MSESQTIIDLQQVVDPLDHEGEPPIRTQDGEPHWFRDRDSMTLRETADLDKKIKLGDRLAAMPNPRETDEELLFKTQCEIIHFLLPTLGEDVIAYTLNRGQRMALVVAFLIDSGMESAMTRAVLSRRDKIGARMSPASSGSTE